MVNPLGEAHTLRSRRSGVHPWWLGLGLLAITLPTLSYAVRPTVRGARVAFFAGLGLAIIIAGLQLMYSHRRRLTVDEVTVSFVSALGRVHSIPRSDVRRVALRLVIRGALTDRRLFLLASDGRCLVALRHFNVDDEEASELAAFLRVPIDRVPIDPTGERRVTMAMLQREIPGATNWFERHRLGYGQLVMLLFAVYGLVVWLTVRL